MSDISPFPSAVFFLNGHGSYRVYYTAEKFVEGAMSGHGGVNYDGVVHNVIMQPNRPNIEVTELVNRIWTTAGHQWDPFANISTDKAVQRKFKRERKAMKDAFIAEVKALLTETNAA
jgi:hypothetical protein